MHRSTRHRAPRQIPGDSFVGADHDCATTLDETLCPGCRAHDVSVSHTTLVHDSQCSGRFLKAVYRTPAPACFIRVFWLKLLIPQGLMRDCLKLSSPKCTLAFLNHRIVLHSHSNHVDANAHVHRSF
eukprot:6192875-Pleurochrysis_carterae.AAC.2